MFLTQSFGEDPNESKTGNMLAHMEEINSTLGSINRKVESRF